MRVCISSGHSTKCQGAIGVLNEVEEATAVVDEVARCLHDIGVPAMAFHDTVSTSQDENLNRIVDWHNSHARDLDVSVHFNASENHQGCGVEVFYQTEAALAAGVSLAISDAWSKSASAITRPMPRSTGPTGR
jgi:N-acetylmuramoyl-L-alanine amidase